MAKLRLIAVAVAMAVTSMLVAGPLLTAGTAHTVPTKATNDVTSIPVHGHVDGSGKKFKGTMKIKQFKIDNGNLKAVTSISGSLKNKSGDVLKTIEGRKKVVRVAGLDSGTAGSVTAQATCEILRLVLGPLHLDILGLQVDLNRVVLTITGETGPGNLLGNLLCAIAGLLDPGPEPLAELRIIRDILNAILGALNL
jgi:hypothetical protein